MLVLLGLYMFVNFIQGGVVSSAELYPDGNGSARWTSTGSTSLARSHSGGHWSVAEPRLGISPNGDTDILLPEPILSPLRVDWNVRRRLSASRQPCCLHLRQSNRVERKDVSLFSI